MSIPCSGCGLVTFPYVCRRASLGHLAGPWQSPRLSGGWPTGLPHMITVGPIQPIPLHGLLDLWIRWSMSTSVTESAGRRVYPV